MSCLQNIEVEEGDVFFWVIARDIFSFIFLPDWLHAIGIMVCFQAMVVLALPFPAKIAVCQASQLYSLSVIAWEYLTRAGSLAMYKRARHQALDSDAGENTYPPNVPIGKVVGE